MDDRTIKYAMIVYVSGLDFVAGAQGLRWDV